jgi:hypothetical protein
MPEMQKYAASSPNQPLSSSFPHHSQCACHPKLLQVCELVIITWNQVQTIRKMGERSPRQSQHVRDASELHNAAALIDWPLRMNSARRTPFWSQKTVARTFRVDFCLMFMEFDGE